MDQTIRQIIELDAAAETRLQASRLQCRSKVKEARQKASAITQAQTHQTRDTITEFEEQTRLDAEEKMSSLREHYEQRAEAMKQQFAQQHEALLDTLFADTLRSAEQ